MFPAELKTLRWFTCCTMHVYLLVTLQRQRRGDLAWLSCHQSSGLGRTCQVLLWVEADWYWLNPSWVWLQLPEVR